MEEQGLLTAEELNEKKVFSLTAQGREAREALDVDAADPTPDLWRETGGGHGALRALPAEIAGQARQLCRWPASTLSSSNDAPTTRSTSREAVVCRPEL